MVPEESRVVVRRFFEEVINGRGLDVIDEIFAPELVRDVRERTEAAFHHYPDYHQSPGPPEDWILAGNKVVTIWTARGTPRGVYDPAQPDVKKMVQFYGIDIFTVVGGKIVEHHYQMNDNLPPFVEGDVSSAKTSWLGHPSDRPDVIRIILTFSSALAGIVVVWLVLRTAMTPPAGLNPDQTAVFAGIAGAAISAISTLVGFVAGQTAGAVGKERAERRADDATARYTALAGEAGPGVLNEARVKYPRLFSSGIGPGGG
ncbi:MAG: ester cyclase [Rubrobacter sp.]|nr:ester cyclase [Rubrobacter sp.]